MSNFDSTTELTEFPPLSPEPKNSPVTSLFSKIFRYNQGSDDNIEKQDSSETDTEKQTTKWISSPDVSQSSDDLLSYPAANEARTLPNVLRRVSSLLATRSKDSPAYKDTNLKQYWMPDSISKECYDCMEKFTTFRRRHHCRVCGQIFCSRCCNQEVPGKILGCSGDLRVCTYCCKVVLSYLQSADIEAELSADLRALQDDLQSKFGTESSSNTDDTRSVSSYNSYGLQTGSSDPKKRKVSLGYQEERFGVGRDLEPTLNEEDNETEQSHHTSTLNSLIEKMLHPETGIPFQSYIHNGTKYNRCFNGSQLIDWLIANKKTSSRTHSSAICQVLLDANYIENLEEKKPSFIDGPEVYKFCESAYTAAASEISRSSTPVAVTHTPAQENRVSVGTPDTTAGSLTQSAFHLDLNVHTNTAHMSRTCKKPDKKKQLSNIIEECASSKLLCEFLQQQTKQIQMVPRNWRLIDITTLNNSELATFRTFQELFMHHVWNTVSQLLAAENLSLSWADTIIPLVECAVDEIKLDFTRTDVIDIRQYIQTKKVEEGDRKNCRVVGGIVCTKNIAHREMYSRLINPRVLLLQCAIVYQRVEGRLLSLEPVMLQEQEYLRHAVGRIAALKPDLVLVHRNVSRLAQESLNALGITLVLNVKLSVLERVSRCTNADILTSIDALVGTTQLGTCRSFYIENFTLKDDKTKTLMFFEGCAFPQLGCTILLRGAFQTELKKLKKVTNLAVLMVYNAKLEKSFLLDEFAKPPETSSFSIDGISPDEKQNSNSDSFRNDDNNCDDKVQNVQNQEIAKKITNKTLIDDTDDDPLHVNLKRRCHQSSIESSPPSDKHDLRIEEVSLTRNRFRAALEDTILSISPLITFDIPYLETDSGRNCELRKYFPKEFYFSSQLGNIKNVKNVPEDIPVVKETPYAVTEKEETHPFITTKFKDGRDSEEVQTLLALYRANGGRYVLTRAKSGNGAAPKAKTKKHLEHQIDIFDLRNHQRLHVLFCSFSHCSNNSPGFCVSPWVVSMDFYGHNDIPLGSFLTKYCFRESYICPSNNCDTPMLDHERRFVHGSGCVHVLLSETKPVIEKSNHPILMWSSCTLCNLVTPVVAMSPDTWSLSFAKYLELRFHGTKYTCRAVSDDDVTCQHLLHQDYCQYFYHKNVVASFRYSSICLLEVSLPPLVLKIHDVQLELKSVLEQVKKWSLMGHEIFSSILEKLHSIENDNTVNAVTYEGMKNHLTKQQALFKQRVEDIQLVITSSIPEEDFAPSTYLNLEQQDRWKLEDSIVMLKKSVAEILLNWNALLHKLLDSKKKEEKQKPKVSLSELPDVKEQKNRSSVAEIQDEATCQAECFEEGNVDDAAADKLWNQFTRIQFLGENELPVDDPVDSQKDGGKSAIIQAPTAIGTRKSASSTSGDEESAKSVKLINDEKSTVSQLNEVLPTSVVSEKISVKAVLSQLLQNPFQTNICVLPNSLNPQEHYLLNVSCSKPVIVYENEPSSVIAYALSTYHYQYSLENLQKQASNVVDSFAARRVSFGNTPKKREAIDNNTNTNDSGQASELEESSNKGNAEDKKYGSSKSCSDSLHIEVSFTDATASFTVKAYFAREFSSLRRLVLADSEESYIRSLGRCVQWAAHGGKSGSAFCKTRDDRFILKQMSRPEIQPFLEFAPNYFSYIQSCYTSHQPTLLGKIVGVYRLKCRTSGSTTTSQSNLLVMENLFYKRDIARKFDLKGSVRNRLVNPDLISEGELVLLDENLINMTCDSPLYTHAHSKTVLMQAINNDAVFLTSQSVMDYSLLVGLDESRRELVVGIIDYIRTFTWDKKLETMVKKSGILGGQGKLPTIVSPEEYKNRFIAAMHKYFLAVPDQWYGFGKGFDY